MTANTRRIVTRGRRSALRLAKKVHKSKAGRWIEIVAAFLIGWTLSPGRPIGPTIALALTFAALAATGTFLILLGVRLLLAAARGRA